MATKKKKRVDESKYHHGDLRRAIMESALEMIAESGIQHLSLREIARKIGVTTAAPYHHFKDRETLLIEIAIQGYAQLLQCLELARGTAKVGREEIEVESRAYLHFAQEHAALYSVMSSSEVANRSAELKSTADRCFLIVCASIAKIRQLGEKQIAEAALSVWSMLHGLIVLDQNKFLLEDRSEQERIAVQGVLAIVRGFLARGDVEK